MAQQDFLPPDFQEELDAAARRKALAQMFLQQGLGQQPQGQMVSGHYVKPSWTQHLAGLSKALMGSYMDAKAGQDINATRRRFGEAQSGELGRIQGLMAGKPEQMGANFVMEPDESGQPAPAKFTAVQGDPMKAEQEAQRSQFPSAQALGKVLMEQRMKREAELQKQLAGRVSLEQVPQVFSGQTQGLTPKQTVQMVEGIPVATPTEVTAGGPQPTRMGPGWQPTQVPGAPGSPPLAGQKNPLTGNVDVFDKAPKTSVQVSTGDKEDPYWKTVATKLGEKDAAIAQAGRDAPPVLETIGRIRKLHLDNKGNYTGGPAAGPVRFLRDLANQFGVPLDSKIDLNNAQMQAEFSNKIAAQILGQGRGLTNEDRQALERAYPSAQVPPQMLPAFLDQYEKLVRANAQYSQKVLDAMRTGSKGSMPTALRPIPITGGDKPMSEWSDAELNARIEALNRGAR